MNAVVKDVMSTHPLSVSTTSSFNEIAAKLREFRVSAVPVLDAGGTVIGVVTRARHARGVVAMRDRLVYPVPHAPSRPGPYF
jgi:CBS-domain-containing membrane protein